MPIVVTPVLSTKAGYIEDVRDQIATFVRFLIMNPGWTSSLWEDRMISFRRISSEYEGNRDLFANVLAGRMQDALTRKFQDYISSVECTTEDYIKDTDDGRYTIKISIMIQKKSTDPNVFYSKEPALITGKIFVKPNNQIALEYDSTTDNLTINN